MWWLTARIVDQLQIIQFGNKTNTKIDLHDFSWKNAVYIDVKVIE